MTSGFDQSRVSLRKRGDIFWVNYLGETTQPSDCVYSAEDVAHGAEFRFEDLSFRDPNFFVAGNLMPCAEQWERVHCPEFILDWVKNGVDIHNMFRHFKGNFKGKSYDSSSPPPAYFPNASSCTGFTKFISDTLLERIANGSISVVGKVGECEPPFLVLPITIEPTKPRMYHDERLLNLWIKDHPFF